MNERTEAELVGIDVGGTFTDFVWLVNGELRVLKQPTTPEDQSRAILQGIKMLGVTDDAAVVHGTTVATNALLERRGAHTALVTTQGFADVLAIGRQNRPHLYKLAQRRLPQLVPKSRRFEIKERIDASGHVVQALDESALETLAEKLVADEIESLAIVFLFSFLNPAHEQQVAAWLRDRLPALALSVSSALLPEYREYERTATTVVNAYVQPLVARYLSRLQDALGRRIVRVMQSSGGVIGLQKASTEAARLVLSGPAGGIVGAFEIARQAMGVDNPHIITFDMGGTSTDVALCPGYLPSTAEGTITDVPLRFPSADIHTVGAGGGSIARVDAGGSLRVGPESAGAYPGPACYGRGGLSATVTDANVVLERLLPTASSDLKLDVGAAHGALEALGARMGMSAEVAALGVLRIANATMERALRKVSVERGYDPRTCTLIPFGGAGPLHACALAEALEIDSILIPQYPGVLSALGLLMADVVYDTASALLEDAATLRSNPEIVEKALSLLVDQVEKGLGSDEQISWIARLDMRYKGQSYEIETPLDTPVSGPAIDAASRAFHEAHQRLYGYHMLEASVEVVSVRLRGMLPGTRPALPREKQKEEGAPTALSETRQVWFSDDGPVEVPCYDRLALKCGHVFAGPAAILQYDTTVLVFPHWIVSIDTLKNMWIRRGDSAPMADSLR